MNLDHTNLFEDNSHSSQQSSIEIEHINVFRHIPKANPIMQKIQFQSYRLNVIYPHKLNALPVELRLVSKYQHQTNMSKLEESLFYHEQLKNKVTKLIKNDCSAKQSTETLFERYRHKQPIYSRFSLNQYPKRYFATTCVDLKTINKKIIQCQQTKTLSNPHRIQFDSNFESGNLYQVYEVHHDTYELILQNDINTRGHNQWFFFRIRNVPKGKTIKLHVMNLVKSDSLFNYGMKPTVFSVKRYDHKKVGWIREGQKISYQENSIRRQRQNRNYRTLSFQYKFMYDDDTVYFSHSFPYTYSDLGSYMTSVFHKKQLSETVTVKQFGKTLAKNKVDLITITNKKISSKDKKIIWIIARQHPGEISSSFMIEGIVNLLTSDQKVACFLKDHFIFKIIPMMNTDGVIHGNSRSELNGSDPNRKWKDASRRLHPIIYQIKKCIQKNSQNIGLVLDLHSHSKKIGTFFYGNTSFHNPQASRLFPYLQCKNDERFTFQNSRFGGGFATTARSVIHKILKIPNVFTVECSFYAYEKNRQIIPYYPDDYRKMGRSLLQNYAHMIYEQNRIHDNRLTLKKRQINLETAKIDLKKQQILEHGDKQSMGSNSCPSQDEFGEDQIADLLPKRFLVKKKRHLKVKEKKRQLSNTERELAPQSHEIRKKTSEFMRKTQNLEKRSLMRYASIQNRTLDPHGKSICQKRLVINFNKAIQTDTFCDILRVQNNKSTGAETKRQNLCIVGFKMEEKEVFLNPDSEIGTQTVLPKTFMINKSEISGRRSFRIPRFTTGMSKQNAYYPREISLKK